jgi:hypothetical protein
MMDELSVIFEPAYLLLDAVGVFAFAVFLLWAVIAQKRHSPPQENEA